MVLEPSRWSIVQKYRAVTEDLTPDQLLSFVCALKAELYAEGLVQGNFTSGVSTHTPFYSYLCEDTPDLIWNSGSLNRSLKSSCSTSWSE